MRTPQEILDILHSPRKCAKVTRDEGLAVLDFALEDFLKGTIIGAWHGSKQKFREYWLFSTEGCDWPGLAKKVLKKYHKTNAVQLCVAYPEYDADTLRGLCALAVMVV